MKNDILIPKKGEKYSFCHFSLNFFNKWESMYVKDVCLINARKDHNHAYYLEYFFYDTLALGFKTFTSKKELHRAIQKLIKENIKF